MHQTKHTRYHNISNIEEPSLMEERWLRHMEGIFSKAKRWKCIVLVRPTVFAHSVSSQCLLTVFAKSVCSQYLLTVFAHSVCSQCLLRVLAHSVC